MSASTRRVVVVAAALAMFSVVIVAIASATASTGRLYRGNPTVYDVCAEGTIVTPSMSNNAYTIAQQEDSGCWSDNYLASGGWLGAKALGYRDGSYCGSTGWHYNSSATYLFGVGSAICSNPAGTQTFYTKADSRAWDPGTSSYDDYLQVTTPNQSG